MKTLPRLTQKIKGAVGIIIGQWLETSLVLVGLRLSSKLGETVKEAKTATLVLIR